MDRKEAIEYAKFRLECYSKGDGKYTEHGEFLVAAIEALQEPETAHCKDCKHWDKEIMYCNHTGMQIEPDGYCVYGERKE